MKLIWAKDGMVDVADLGKGFTAEVRRKCESGKDRDWFWWSVWKYDYELFNSMRLEIENYISNANAKRGAERFLYRFGLAINNGQNEYLSANQHKIPKLEVKK